jgi:hypothetical protein
MKSPTLGELEWAIPWSPTARTAGLAGSVTIVALLWDSATPMPRRAVVVAPDEPTWDFETDLPFSILEAQSVPRREFPSLPIEAMKEPQDVFGHWILLPRRLCCKQSNLIDFVFTESNSDET